jgi:RNA polymerase sigma-70 factor, ECF subfamily
MNTATPTDTSREWHHPRVGFRRVARTETDEEAFERHVLPEIEVLLRVARSMTRNHAEAEDLVQDTLIRAYRGIGGFDGRYPRAWLLTILRNTHINRNRRRRPELLRDQDATFERLRVGLVDRSADVLVEQTIDGEILAALDELSDDFRRVVELVDIDGLSYPEAAEVLGVPVGTVMSRLHRARRRIRDRLDRAGLAPRFREHG